MRPLSAGALRKLLARVVSTARARKARHLYLCAPLVRGRKGHHQPMADWIRKQGYELMRVDGRLVRADAFQKLDRYKEHDIEVVVADLKGNARQGPALDDALRVGKGACFLLAPPSEVLSWFSTTRTDIETGEPGARSEAVLVQFLAGVVPDLQGLRAHLSVDAERG